MSLLRAGYKATPIVAIIVSVEVAVMRLSLWAKLKPFL